MKTNGLASRSAFTLAEVAVGMAVGIIAGTMALSYMRTSAILLAKNISANRSNNTLRNAIDSMGDRLHGALTMPVLIDTTGSVVSSLPANGTVGDSQPAAGVFYDRLIGDPYVLIHPGGAGLLASDSSVSLKRSISPYASPPIPAPGDVLLIESAPAEMRPRVATVNAGAVNGNVQTIALTFTSSLGSAISWSVSRPKVARLVHREALLVMPSGTRRELRRYPTFEPMPSLNDSTKYSVISNEIGSQGAEETPFYLTTTNAFENKLFKLDLRVRVIGYERVLATKEANQFSAFMRVQTVIPIRSRPK
ncbi:MAG: hypothetical protein JWL59_4533 [Chthoniobacteraceae bacterium]|nr:hypothetical protein [Chthoniobacteraceae bacterium]